MLRGNIISITTLSQHKSEFTQQAFCYSLGFMHKAMLHLKELSYYYYFDQSVKLFFVFLIICESLQWMGQISEFKKKMRSSFKVGKHGACSRRNEGRFLKSQQTFWSPHSLICSRFLLICNRWQSHYYCVLEPLKAKYTLRARGSWYLIVMSSVHSCLAWLAACLAFHFISWSLEVSTEQ